MAKASTKSPCTAGRASPSAVPVRRRGALTRVGGGWGMADILDRIVQAKRAQVARDKETVSPRRLIELATSAPPPRDLPAALRREGHVNVIAEIKKASPSRGAIQARADAAGVAQAYASAGAVARSVLTG